jgi:ribonuclease P protein component
MHHRHRLTGDKRYSQIHRQGRSAANRLLVVRYLPNGLDRSRFGFLVSKRIGNAVARNKVRRRLREAVRGHQVIDGWDAAFIARRGIEDATFQQLQRAVSNLLRRARLVGRSRRDGGPDTGGESST